MHFRILSPLLPLAIYGFDANYRITSAYLALNRRRTTIPAAPKHHSPEWADHLPCYCRRWRSHCYNWADTICQSSWETGIPAPLPRLFTIGKPKILPGFFASSIFAVIPSNAACLNGRGQYDRAGISAFFQHFQQRSCKHAVTFHKLFRLSGLVDTCQIEHEVCAFAGGFQHRLVRIDILDVDLVNSQIQMSPVFSLLYVLKGHYKVTTHETFGSGY